MSVLPAATSRRRGFSSERNCVIERVHKHVEKLKYDLAGEVDEFTRKTDCALVVTKQFSNINRANPQPTSRRRNATPAATSARRSVPPSRSTVSQPRYSISSSTPR